MKHYFLNFLAIVFPWMIFFMNDEPLAGLGVMVLQATLIGWIPASMLAWKKIHAPDEKKAEEPAEPPKDTA